MGLGTQSSIVVRFALILGVFGPEQLEKSCQESVELDLIISPGLLAEGIRC